LIAAGAAAAGGPAAGAAVGFEVVEDEGVVAFRQADRAIDATSNSDRNFVIGDLWQP
jgi:hypothetical protein